MSTLTEGLQSVYNEVEMYDELQIVATGYPLKHYMAEVQLAVDRLLEMQDILTAGGMNFYYIERVTLLNSVCSQLKSKALSTTFSTLHNRQRWNNFSDEADLMLWDFKQAAVYACREHKELVAFVYATYDEGGSNREKIQSLKDFVTFGQTKASLFTAINYDMENFKRAEELSRKMTTLLDQASLDGSNNPMARILRDKAFSIMKRMIEDLNAQARFIFRSNKIEAAKFMIHPPQIKQPNKIKKPVLSIVIE